MITNLNTSNITLIHIRIRLRRMKLLRTRRRIIRTSTTLTIRSSTSTILIIRTRLHNVIQSRISITPNSSSNILLNSTTNKSLSLSKPHINRITQLHRQHHRTRNMTINTTRLSLHNKAIKTRRTRTPRTTPQPIRSRNLLNNRLTTLTRILPRPKLNMTRRNRRIIITRISIPIKSTSSRPLQIHLIRLNRRPISSHKSRLHINRNRT